MTEAYLMTTRNGKRVPVEIEHLTDEERAAKFANMTPEEIVGWLNFLCRFLRNVEQSADAAKTKQSASPNTP